MTATLTAETIAGARVLEVDCPHGRTVCRVVDDEVTDRAAVRLVVWTHFANEGCRCTRKLRTRYGV
jgi:hypothetical protein